MATLYPAELDELPSDIQPETSEDAAGLEHDVLHNRVNAAVNALQALLGTGTPAHTVLQRLTALEASEGGGGGGFNPGRLMLGSDLLTLPATTESSAVDWWTSTASGGSVLAGNVPDHPGVVVLRKSTTASSQANLNFKTPCVRLADGALRLDVCLATDLPPPVDATANAYVLRFGLRVAGNSQGDTDWLCGEFYGAASILAGLRGRAKSASVETVGAESELRLLPSTFAVLSLVTNSDASVAEFYMDGELAGTVTTNIPAAVQLRPFVQIWDAAGSTSRQQTSVSVDYISLSQTLNALR